MATVLKRAVTRKLPRIPDRRGRALIVRLDECGVALKFEGERWTSAYDVPWGSLYKLGASLRALRNAREREEARKARKAARLARAAGV